MFWVIIQLAVAFLQGYDCMRSFIADEPFQPVGKPGAPVATGRLKGGRLGPTGSRIMLSGCSLALMYLTWQSYEDGELIGTVVTGLFALIFTAVLIMTEARGYQDRKIAVLMRGVTSPKLPEQTKQPTPSTCPRRSIRASPAATKNSTNNWSRCSIRRAG